MSNLNIPFNIGILDLSSGKLQNIKPVTVQDIFDGTGHNFHEEGLFSTSIFGRAGEEIRDYRFSYIDIKIDVFHPILFKSLTQLKSLYGEICAGREYAVWNPDLKDFEKATALTGDTGFHFFMRHWKEINFAQTKSDMREQYILLLTKFKDTATTSKIVVLPAGLRDVEFGDNGRIEENEINKLYRKLLAISNVVNASTIKNSPEVLNSARWSLQVTFNEIFAYFQTIIEGKKKMVSGKWASRKTWNTTRNVITSMDANDAVLGDPNNFSFNYAGVGLFQALKNILPVAKHSLKTGFLSKVFISKDLPVKLVNKKTLRMEEVTLKTEYFDRWTSDDGLDKIIEGFREEFVRHKPVEIMGFYLGLIYKGPDQSFKLMQDIEELPEGRDKKDVYPLTFCELLYLSVYKNINKYPQFITRYPVAGMGSIQPAYQYVKTTQKSEVRMELGPQWDLIPENKAVEFPITGGSFMNSLVPHASRIKNMTADFDGDMCSSNATYSDNAVEEIRQFFHQKRAYLGTDGKLLHSANVDTINFVVHNLTTR